MKLKAGVISAMVRELELQTEYLGGRPLASVYFGGGTPSLLTEDDMNELWRAITDIHSLLPGAEVTLEANPDDLTPGYLNFLRDHTPVNRLSIGLQSFSDADLRWMNRAHRADQALSCLEDAIRAGFEDLTIDLIYGAPTTSDKQWARNLEIVFDLGIPHFSCYALTVEPQTALDHFIKHQKAAPPDEEQSARQYEFLMEAAARRGYIHYEISNFALPGRYARHNSNYWKGEAYLGIGPSAHSFDGKKTRQWNIANNALYIKALEQDQIPFEHEVLSLVQQYHEKVMTALRTVWGLDPRQLVAPFDAYFLDAVKPFMAAGQVENEGGVYRLTAKGKLMADGITSALFYE